MGSDCPQDIPCPQDVHARGIWLPPHGNGASQHIGQKLVFQSDNVHVFAEENENESDNNTVTTITQTAALTTTPSSTGTAKDTAVSAKVAAAINQLLANQTTMIATWPHDVGTSHRFTHPGICPS